MQKAREDSIRFAGFSLSPSYRKLSGPSGEIFLRAKSLDVLIYLAERPGKVVSKTELLDAIWPDVTVSDESLERCISDIRAAISDQERRILKTVARRGYILAVQVDSAIQEPAVQHRTSKVLAVSLFAVLAVAIALFTLLSRPQADQPQLLAVLPLQNVSGNPDADYFSEGLTEDLVTTLTRLKTVGVVGTGSSAKFAKSELGPMDIGEKLGAKFLLSGRIQRNTQIISLALQLVDTSTGAQVWSGSYEGAPEGFVEGKANLVRKIATTLDAHIAIAELNEIASKPATDLTSYDLVLQGNALLRNIHLERRGEAISTARDRYQAAATIDPRSSRAAEGLANSYLMAWMEPSPGHKINEEFQSPNILQWAADYARQAVELDETSASARATLGWVLYWQSGPAEALALFDKANELDPGRVDWRYGLMLSHGGRAVEAEAYMKRIMQVDPLYPPRYKYLLGKAYYFQGRYKEAFPLIKQAAAEMPTHRPSHVLLAAVASNLGMKAELPAYIQDIFKLDASFSTDRWLKYIRFSDHGYQERMRLALISAGLPP